MQRASYFPCATAHVRDGTHGVAEAAVALVAVPPRLAGAIAEALDRKGFVCVVTFAPGRVLKCLVEAAVDVAIVDLDYVPLERAVVEAARDGSPVPLVEVARAAVPGRARAAVTRGSIDALADRALLAARRRARSEDALQWGALTLDVPSRRAWWRSVPIDLTALQFRILRTLVAARGAVVTGEDLARVVWGTSAFHDHERLLAHVRRIRKRIESDPSRPRFLLTVRGEGFRLAADDDAVRSEEPAYSLRTREMDATTTL
ncbi:MAG TPA: winged helix-turn-helix domain-containing protein [Actinomycetota bacterium]|nr:winged helix-turn-helix domain-containing protein [Actinomycetota bacterium]